MTTTVARGARLELSREQILAFRRQVNALGDRLPPGPDSLRFAARAGLTDSVPRAAILSIHARVAATPPSALDDPALVQLWGPRFSAYVVAPEDRAVFTLGRLPEDAAGLQRAVRTADRLEAILAGRRLAYGEVGHALGINPNMLRYAAPTGRVLIHWDGAKQPIVWTVPPPEVDPSEARLELARRYLHVLGPGTAAGFGRWAGIRLPRAGATFERLAPSLTPVRTPVGDGSILAADEAKFREPARGATGARLLSSGDTYFLCWVADRELLVPDAARRAELWTTRVWPGAVLVDGEIVGTWRRAEADVAIRTWRQLTPADRDAVAAEATSLPLPGLRREIAVTWER